MNSFSYLEYSNIIRNVLTRHPILDYRDVTPKTDRFAIIRHDVEFSVHRALRMAVLEHMLGIRSSYFFQIRNGAYNLFSQNNIQAVQEIKQMGHQIGLHVHMGMLDNRDQIKDYIIKDIEIMERIVNLPIDRFSFHRPSKEVLSLNLKIPGLVNTYDELYFHFKADDLVDLKIKYLADSMHRWKYGYPDEKTLKEHSKIQLLVHPDEWTIAGYNTDTNFLSLGNEKCNDFFEIVSSETKHFPKDFRNKRGGWHAI